MQLFICGVHAARLKLHQQTLWNHLLWKPRRKKICFKKNIWLSVEATCPASLWKNWSGLRFSSLSRRAQQSERCVSSDRTDPHQIIIHKRSVFTYSSLTVISTKTFTPFYYNYLPLLSQTAQFLRLFWRLLGASGLACGLPLFIWFCLDIQILGSCSGNTQS